MGENDLRWLLWVLGGFQAVLTLIIGAGVRALFSLSARISEQNGRIGRLDTWKLDHEKLDDERHERNLDSHGRLRDAIDDLHRLPRDRSPAEG